LENTEKELHILDAISLLPTDEFLKNHIYKTDALLKFYITETIHKYDFSKTELIAFLEFLNKLKSLKQI
jgi:hypothetical protein